MALFSGRGGAQVGWLNASWPLASIRVEPGRLTVRALGSHVFEPSDVQAVEAVGSLPVLASGIRIHHTLTDHPERIVFYTPGNREALLRAVEAAGFAVGAPVLQVKRGFPMRIGAIVAVVVLWNGLFLLDFRGGEALENGGMGLSSLLALVLAFAVASLLPHSRRLQGWFLREGRQVGEIRGLLRLLQLVAGVLVVAGVWMRSLP